MPGYGDTLRGEEVQGAGHGHYWGQDLTTAARKATELAGRFLDLGLPARRLAAPRALGLSRAIG